MTAAGSKNTKALLKPRKWGRVRHPEDSAFHLDAPCEAVLIRVFRQIISGIRLRASIVGNFRSYRGDRIPPILWEPRYVHRSPGRRRNRFGIGFRQPSMKSEEI